MKKEQVLELMSALDLELVEEAALQAPAGRRIPRLARAGLIAACLCLVLVGTGAAAVANGWIRVSDVKFYPTTHVNGTKSSYAEVNTASDGSPYIPMDQFSQEAQEFPYSSTYLPQYKGFDSWADAEEFLGVEISDNPVLDRMEPIPWSLEDKQYGIKMDEANCFVSFRGLMEAPMINLHSEYQLVLDDSREFRLGVYAGIFTQESSSGRGPGAIFQNHEMPVTETYVTPSGLQAVIVTAYTGSHPDSSVSCQTLFQLNGANFHLITAHDDKDEMVRIIKEILDAYS